MSKLLTTNRVNNTPEDYHDTVLVIFAINPEICQKATQLYLNT